MTRFPSCLPVVLLLAIMPSAFSADQNDAVEKRLRDTLRSTMIQLRTAETDKAALLAAKTDLEATNKTLTARIDADAKRSAAEKENFTNKIDNLTRQGEAQGRETEKLKKDLAEWKAGFQKAADVARSKEAERAKLAQEGIELHRLVADRESKNLALFRIGNEILKRYETFGLGTALGAREPFVGTTRVKLQNLVQDYSDQLRTQRARPNDLPPAPAPAKAAAPAPAPSAPATAPKAADPAAKEPAKQKDTP